MRIVILRGGDQYLMTAHTRQLAAALRQVYGEIETFEFDGAAVEPAVVLDELRSYGLMQQHKLVILDRADQFLAAKDEDAPAAGRGGRRTARELMEAYAANPVDSATLLMRAATWRPGRLDKAVAKVGTIIKCEAPGEAKAVSWCQGRAEKEYGCRLDRQAAQMLVERIGPELARLDTELGKLSAYVGEAAQIGPEAVRELVGLSREEKVWVIQNAVLSGSPRQAVEKLQELISLARRPEDAIVPMTWAMTDLLRKLHAAAQLLRQGETAAAVGRQLKLWGPAGEMVLAAARRGAPQRFAQLLRLSLEADRRGKRGIGNPPRTLETLAVRIADTMGS